MEKQDSVLERVRDFAEKAHGKQKRKYVNEPYINHTVRVRDILREFTNDEAVLSAALLHDVLEDTEVTEEELLDFLQSVFDEVIARKTIELVKDLTDEFIKSKYPDLNRRARRSQEAIRLANTKPDAHTIKYADIIDNVRDIVASESDFALVYIRECKTLLQRLTKGNGVLYSRALQTVDDAMQAYWRKANVRSL